MLVLIKINFKVQAGLNFPEPVLNTFHAFNAI